MSLFALKLPEPVPQEDLETSLGPLLGRLAKKLKVKQTDLAKKSKISRISVNRFFRGRSEVRASDLVTLLNHLGIDLEKQIREKLDREDL